MALTFSLVQRTQYRLTYLCIPNGGSTGVTDSGTLPNTGTGTPDLGGDIATWNQYPFYTLLRKPVANQAAARALFGDTLTSVLSVATPRAKLSLRVRTAPAGTGDWGVDANLGTAGSAGFAVLDVVSPASASASCYLDIEFLHTLVR
jgi:hypothetical protein